MRNQQRLGLLVHWVVIRIRFLSFCHCWWCCSACRRTIGRAYFLILFFGYKLVRFWESILLSQVIRHDLWVWRFWDPSKFFNFLNEWWFFPSGWGWRSSCSKSNCLLRHYLSWDLSSWVLRFVPQAITIFWQMSLGWIQIISAPWGFCWITWGDGCRWRVSAALTACIP